MRMEERRRADLVEGYSTFDKGGSVSAIYCGPVEV